MATDQILQQPNPCTTIRVEHQVSTFLNNLAESLGLDSSDADIAALLSELGDQLSRALKDWKDKTKVFLTEAGGYSAFLALILLADFLGFDPNVLLNPIGYINTILMTSLMFQFVAMYLTLSETPYYYLMYRSLVTLEEQLLERQVVLDKVIASLRPIIRLGDYFAFLEKQLKGLDSNNEVLRAISDLKKARHSLGLSVGLQLNDGSVLSADFEPQLFRSKYLTYASTHLDNCINNLHGDFFSQVRDAIQMSDEVNVPFSENPTLQSWEAFGDYFQNKFKLQEETGGNAFEQSIQVLAQDISALTTAQQIYIIASIVASMLENLIMYLPVQYLNIGKNVLDITRDIWDTKDIGKVTTATVGDVLLSDVQTLRDTNARVTMVEQIIARFDITFKSVSLLGQQAYTLLYPILTGLKSVQTEIEGHVLTEKGQKIVTNITNTERTEWIKTLLKHKSTVDTMVSNPLKGQAGGSYGNSINSLLGENNAINNEKLVDINTNYQWLIKYLSGSSEIDDVLFDNVASLKQPADTVVDFSQDLVANFSQNVYSGKFKNFMPSFKEMLYKLNEQRQKDIQIINISKVIRRDLETLPGFNIMLNEVEGINDLLKDSWFSNLSDQLSTGNLALLNAGLQSLSELGCLGTVSSTSNVQDLPIIKEVFGYVYGGSKSALKKVQNYLDRTEEENKTCQAKVTTITDYMQKLENYAAVTPEVPLDITLPT